MRNREKEPERPPVIQVPEMESAMESGSDEDDFTLQDEYRDQALPREEAERVISRMGKLEEVKEKSRPPRKR